MNQTLRPLGDELYLASMAGQTAKAERQDQLTVSEEIARFQSGSAALIDKMRAVADAGGWSMDIMPLIRHRHTGSMFEIRVLGILGSARPDLAIKEDLKDAAALAVKWIEGHGLIPGLRVSKSEESFGEGDIIVNGTSYTLIARWAPLKTGKSVVVIRDDEAA